MCRNDGGVAAADHLATNLEAGMGDEGETTPRRGRQATTAAILDAAQELFAARGYDAVSVREIAERAGVTHALVHLYLGDKADLLRAVLTRNESAMLAASAEDPDLMKATSLMLRHGLTDSRSYLRLVVRSAMGGMPYDRTSGRFEATERLVELATQVVNSATPADRAAKPLDPRFVIACVVTLTLGWAATQSWVLPATGLADLEESEAIDGLEQVMLGILRDNLPGLERAGAHGRRHRPRSRAHAGQGHGVGDPE
jgi:AcrR family transcriptional regulator